MVQLARSRANNVRISLSLIIIIGYFILLFAIIAIEASDRLNMTAGENSLMDVVKILIGVLTTIVAKIVFFWFDPHAPDVQIDKDSADVQAKTPDKIKGEA